MDNKGALVVCESFSGQIKLPYATLSYGNTARIHESDLCAASREILAELVGYATEALELKEQRSKLVNEVKAVLHPITTYKRLLETWPDVTMFWSPDTSNDPTKALTIRADNLQAMIAELR
jgi:hypothetical protein